MRTGEIASLVLGLAALGFVQAKWEQSSQAALPAAWVSEVGSAIGGRPLSLHDGSLNLQRVQLGAKKRDKSARFYKLPEVGQYLVRVRHPVRKNLASELRAVAVGPVRYLPHDTFVAVLSGSTLQSVLDLEGVEDLFLRPPESKVARELMPENAHVNVRRAGADPEIFPVVAELVEVRGHADWQSVIEDTMQQWQSSLAAIAGPKFDISLRSRKYVAVMTDSTHMDGVVHALAEHPLVSGVMNENVLVHPQNYLAGEAIMSASGASEHRMWDKGLKGSGEIVGVHDSGLDFDMGWFVDSDQTIAKCGADVDSVWQFDDSCKNLNHRKIVSYRQTTGSDFGVYDIVKGHGTHVAGIVAGAREDNNHAVEGTGICPECKLVIDDMDNTATYNLYAGSNIGNMMQHSYDVGARLHSCSIGKAAGTNWYGEFSKQWDEWLVTNDDTLILNAAGNYGPDDFTIVDPAPAKNTVTVGMVQNGRRSGRYNDDTLPDSGGAGGANRDAFSTEDIRKDFIRFDRDEWETFRSKTPLSKVDPYDWDFKEGSATLDDYYNSPRLEVTEVDWGRKLGSNEVVEGPLLGLDLCACLNVTKYPYPYPSEPWTLMVLWDWGYGASRCVANSVSDVWPQHGNCQNKDASWDLIMYLYDNHNMQGLILIEPNCQQGGACDGMTADQDQWWVLERPSGVDSSNPAPFPIGQVMREGTGLHAYVSGDWYWHYFSLEYWYNAYSGDPADYSNWEPYLVGGSGPSYGEITPDQYTKSMHAVWPHDQRSYIAPFSSRGPTLDLRFIPDVMCPGMQLKSASGDGDETSEANLFDLTLKTGTSMATPVCAGGAALIRQYLREGWYGDGTMGSAAAISSPSGALIKAMMINSAQPVYAPDGGVGEEMTNYWKMTEYPNFHGGFGRLSLDHVMMFDDSAFNLRFGERISLDQSDTYEICVSVTDASEPLVVTVTWADPAAVENTIRALVNDLDLVVVSEAGDFHYGNNIMWTDEVNTAGRPVRDSRNNVEKVKINVPTVGKYSIRISGTDVPDGPQNVAYAMTGIFSDASGECAALSACENDCSGHGTCSCGGGCVCEPEYSGTDCSFLNAALTSTPRTISLGAASTAYYTIDASSCSNFVVTYEVTAGEAYVLLAEGVHPVDYGSAADVKSGINERLHYAEYGTLPASFGLPNAGASGEQTITVENAATGTWVLSVTSVVDPKPHHEDPTAATTTTITAKVDMLTPTSSCPTPAPITPGCTTITSTGDLGGGPGGGGGDVTVCPAQDSAYASCTLNYTWPELTDLYQTAPNDLYVGGLGKKMVVDKCESYVCVAAARVSGCSPSDWVCFYYDEMTQEFKPWGVNGDLQIF